MPVADTVRWEHSEPGTGPTPVNMSPESDKAIKNGWRLGSPPAAKEGHEDPFVDPPTTGDLEF